MPGAGMCAASASRSSAENSRERLNQPTGSACPGGSRRASARSIMIHWLSSSVVR